MFYKFSLLFCIAVGITIVGFGQDIEVAKSVDSLMEKSLNYPKTRRVETSTTYYNEEFLDDYGWLEKNSDSEVQNWMAAQDSFMQSYARNFPQYGAIRKKVSDLSNVRGMMALPKYSRDYVFYVNDDVDGKGYLFRKPTNGGDPEIMSLPFDARAAPFFIPNSQGTYVALGLALPGGYFDWKIYDVQESPQANAGHAAAGAGRVGRGAGGGGCRAARAARRVRRHSDHRHGRYQR